MVENAGKLSTATPTQGKGFSKVHESLARASPRSVGRPNSGVPESAASGLRTARPPSPRGKKKTGTQYDRFIPNRSAMDMASSQFNIARAESDAPLDGATIAYQEEVARACGVSMNKRILTFKEEAPTSEKDDLRQIYSRPALKSNASTNTKRRILNTPERVLDAPGLVDDYYLNLLDWSIGNVLAIGLDQSVYLWNATTGDVESLCQLEGDAYISSVKWTADGSYLAIGVSEGDVQIWDAESQSKIRTMSGHQARVGVMSWERHILSSGCRDGSIWNHDVRVANHKTAELIAHNHEVCGLTWRMDGAFLASGGNDNLVNIWDARSTVPKFTKTQHTAAVRALAWSPWQLNLLASGGGSYDRHVHFWNTTTTARLNSIDTGSQVTSIQFSNEYRELVTSHGFPHNHLALWSYPSLAKIVDIPAHDTRVLHTAMSPDGQTIATAASDESLKFWRIFESRTKSGRASKGSSAMPQAAAATSAYPSQIR
ncbi:WD repeat-containing protein slp1 [Coemansia sp. RSA 989]|nr:WD40 repeat-containing protein [Coemansia mojavensis]KAJ1739612.1 WD repeat-containing protein slp1 [Coemansia sp. RSA 1086]KAJ1752019.1 WD repeat-containing protein slp1 [Coemansia sp. RSA 1821]KAJ1867466.1 WD repeat-containing protein slp1 [Coemansia sp. RSA 989]KAJ1874879.1 WD repeat-containing protein slp1 [Coemansia sp. RSA 990]KAJ2649158.1 WD repeat-containing protein slp1 [Coemansia sp. RSA 1250]KAJ2671569.1 WD repeat-containing protein slp1 [Coemansia sp. RSA 1085]